MDNRPIGVFDSCLGGLTGVRELRKRLPHEEIIYFEMCIRDSTSTLRPRS